LDLVFTSSQPTKLYFPQKGERVWTFLFPFFITHQRVIEFGQSCLIFICKKCIKSNFINFLIKFFFSESINFLKATKCYRDLEWTLVNAETSFVSLLTIFEANRILKVAGVVAINWLKPKVKSTSTSVKYVTCPNPLNSQICS